MAALKAAELKIDIDSKEHGYLIPYGGDVQLQVGYRFYVHKFMNSPLVNNFVCQVVYKNDTFKIVQGSKNEVIHEPCYDDTYGNPAEIKLFYAHIELKNGMQLTEVITRSEIDTKIRKGTDAWKNYYSEMGKKSVCKRLAKWVQLDDEDMQEVSAYENSLTIDNESSAPEIEIMNVPEADAEVVNEKHQSKEIKNKPVQKNDQVDVEPDEEPVDLF